MHIPRIRSARLPLALAVGTVATLAFAGAGMAQVASPPATTSGTTPVTAPAPEPTEPTSPSATPHIDAVAQAIRDMEASTGSDSTEGVLWSVTDGNTLPGAGTPDPAWLVRTQDCWGQTGDCSSDAVQQRLLATIRGIIGSATTVADVSSLTKLPQGAFLQAIVDGAADAEAAGRTPTIRLMWGRTPATPVTDGLFIDRMLASIRTKVQKAAPHATVVAGFQSNTPVLNGYSWNHSKIVAADGRVALAMGINLWEASYLQSNNPVTDVGAVVEGPAAAGAERFLDVIWRSMCRHPGKGLAHWNTIIKASSSVACPATMTPDPQPGTGGARVLAVGRSGYIRDGRTAGRTPWFQPSSADRSDSGCTLPPIPNPMNGDAAWDGRNPSDTAIRALVHSAHRRIVIGQQEMIFPCAIDPSYDLRLMDELARKVVAGVKVRVVVSNADGAINSTETYSSNPQSTLDVLMKRLRLITGSQAKAQDVACKWLVVAPFRYSTTATWPNGKPPALHGKVVAVDDAAFYVGSQNAYPNQLPEFGYIIEDPVAMHDFRRDYLEQMLKYSRAAQLPCR